MSKIKIVRIIILTFLVFIIFSYNLYSLESIDYSIRANVKIDSTDGLKAIISWLPDTLAKEYIIKRKPAGDTDWSESLAEFDSTGSIFIDSTIKRGEAYEYFIKKKSILQTDTTAFIFDGYTYLSVGVDYPVTDYRGRLLLLVDNTIHDSIQFELNRFVYDLSGDGWNVVKRVVPRTEKFNGDSVKQIKKIIVEEFYNHPDSLTALIILGRIAVPYSGDNAIDGHENHQGAWTADVYYADIDGDYTDEKVLDTIAERAENINIPSDGKFDNNIIDTDVELEAGRIDFHRIKYFKISENQLYRNYLQKDHDYRHAIIKPDYKATIDDNFGAYQEPFAVNAWNDFSALLGTNTVDTADFRLPLGTNAKLWAYGCGAGHYVGVTNTLSLYNLDTMNTGGIFSILFGSYNVDWDFLDNILRAQIAFSPYGLTVSWSGRPFWHFHPMGLANTMGYITKLAQNNNILYESNDKYGFRGMHISLIGDPTLRMWVEEPPSNLRLITKVTYDSNIVYLNWESSDNNLIGFNVYRSSDIYQKFEKINNTFIQEKKFTDINPNSGNNIYMVRAVRKSNTATATLINMSQGIFAETDLPKLNFSYSLSYSLKCYPNPADQYTNITIVVPNKENVKLSVWDLNGKLVKEIINKSLSPGYYSYSWDLKNQSGNKVQTGIYFIRFESGNEINSLSFRVL